MSNRNENKRIGVYVCHCGGNISDVVDVEKVVEAVKDYPGVVIAKHYEFMCSDAGQKMIETDIKEYNLDGVVVASCSPKLHELTFKNVLQRAGLNPYKYYHVNIREDSSWPHSDDPEEATKKAIREVKAGIDYVKSTKDLKKIKAKAYKSILVIGGGLAGLRAALNLENMGLKVILIEKSPFVGGFASRLYKIFPSGQSGKDVVNALINEVKQNKNIIVLTNAEIEKIGGYVGNFQVTVKVNPRYVVKDHPKLKEAIEKCPVEVPDEFTNGLTKRKAIYYPYEGAYPELPVIDMSVCTKCGECTKIVGDSIDLNQKPEIHEFKVGAIVVATGFKPYEPKEGEFGYKTYSEVITLPELHSLLNLTNENEKTLTYNKKPIKTIAFIYCVGSRQAPREGEKVNQYCSRYCCNAALHIAQELMKRFNGIKTYHLYRDIRSYGKNELYYLDAAKSGAVFIRFTENEPPEVSKEGEKLIVRVKDTLTAGEKLKIPVDLVVLVVGMVPRENRRLEELTKINVGLDGFYQEAHPKLRPVETFQMGLLLAGTCQAPRDIPETLSSASAAAAKAGSLVMKGSIELEPLVAYVDPKICNLSKLCISECPANAISIKEYEGLGKRAWVNEVLCIGCGACTAVCPTEAIQLKTLSTKQIYDMIKAMAEVS